jgi:hypothetical protein
MTSLKEAIARLFRDERATPDLPDPDFDYRVFWTKQAMAWPSERQELILSAIKILKSDVDLAESPMDQRFHLDGLDDERYSGGSLLALEVVLLALLKDGSTDERKS